MPQWSHVAVTMANNVARFYVNGQLVQVVPDAEGDADTLINTLLQNVQVGWDSCESHFTGAIDELAVFNVALTGPQVQDLYDNGIAGFGSCSPDSDGDGVPDDQDGETVPVVRWRRIGGHSILSDP